MAQGSCPRGLGAAPRHGGAPAPLRHEPWALSHEPLTISNRLIHIWNLVDSLRFSEKVNHIRMVSALAFCLPVVLIYGTALPNCTISFDSKFRGSVEIARPIISGECMRIDEIRVHRNPHWRTENSKSCALLRDCCEINAAPTHYTWYTNRTVVRNLPSIRVERREHGRFA